MGHDIYMNRELSWLKFNERVLEEAERKDVPLCERLSFLSIYQSNLDEFFMVRIGSLIDRAELDPDGKENKTNMTAKEQIEAAVKKARELNERKDEVYEKLLKMTADYGMRLLDIEKITAKEKEKLKGYFEKEIKPLISRFITGKEKSFPFLKNGHIYAAAVLQKKSGKVKIGMIPCTAGVFPRLIELPWAENTYALSEELILYFISEIFPEYEVTEKALIRVTRNADIDADALYDEDLDYREFMEELVKKRRRLSPVRLEIRHKLGKDTVKIFLNRLEIRNVLVFKSDSPLDLSFLYKIRDNLRHRSELFYAKRVPRFPACFKKGEAILPQIREKDKLLSYPFESMKPFISMLYEAAADKFVSSIKMTLYRAARQSEVIKALCEAAENGKDVLVLVELKARFDEENNIEWSRRLEEAGCRVIYGLNGYKVHSKLCLITRKTDSGIEYFTQIGTGNYNEETARLYTDFSLMTGSAEIGRETKLLFESLEADSTSFESKILMTAPSCLQKRVLEKIDEERQKGEDGYIGAKINSLSDKRIIDSLTEASKAGVRIDLIVRGICCLVPRVDKKTENIRVISIVGRLLEHSRIYIFGKENPEVYLSSADLMTRNTLRRVEAAVPILDVDIRRKILDMFKIMLSDNTNARELTESGEYKRVEKNGKEVNSQEIFYDTAYSEDTETV